MERMALWPLAWLAGVLLQLQQAGVWPQPVQALLCAVGGLGVLAARRLPAHGALALVLGLGALLMLGAGSTAWRADLRLAESLPAPLEGQDMQVVGVAVPSSAMYLAALSDSRLCATLTLREASGT